MPISDGISPVRLLDSVVSKQHAIIFCVRQQMRTMQKVEQEIASYIWRSLN